MNRFVKKIDIAPLSMLDETQCKSFRLDVNGIPLEGFLVKTAQSVAAYKNACPHWHVELNWKPDCFLNEEGGYIICAIHGALFQKDDGLCVWGPCVRQKLEAIPVEVQDGIVYFLPNKE